MEAKAKVSVEWRQIYSNYDIAIPIKTIIDSPSHAIVAAAEALGTGNLRFGDDPCEIKDYTQRRPAACSDFPRIAPDCGADLPNHFPAEV